MTEIKESVRVSCEDPFVSEALEDHDPQSHWGHKAHPTEAP